MATYYIDYNAANDSANGTSTSTPWKRCPGMTGFTGSYAHAAGDRFIFKGGVTWPITSVALKLAITNGGNGSGNDYYGIDATWYTGGSWTRPIFTASGATLGTTTNNRMIDVGANYVTIDNIELTGFYWDSGSGSFGSGYIYMAAFTNCLFSNLYIHGWSHASAASGCTDLKGAITAYTGSSAARNNVISNCIFDGSDTTGGGDSMSATYGYGGAVRGCTVKNMSNGFLLNSAYQEVSGCTISNINLSFDAAEHENAIESVGGSASGVTTVKIFNNIIHDTLAVNIFVGNVGAGADITYFYNNVSWNSPPTFFEIDARGASNPNTVYCYNNTYDGTGGSSSAVRVVGSSSTTTFIGKNNHWIASSVDTTGMTSPVQSNNVSQTLAVANGQGYNNAQVHPYSPVSSLVATYNTGTPDTDTGSTADILGVIRPQDGVWDVGAYEFMQSAILILKRLGAHPKLIGLA